MTQQDKLSTEELSKARSFGLRKTIKFGTAIYNRACKKCKGLMISNSRRPAEDYCDKCRVEFLMIYRRME